MPREIRSQIIKKIEEKRSSKLICYLTGDRAPFLTKIADDSVLIIQKHLESIGKTSRISLFLYSRGGDVVIPLRLVRLIREFCDGFEVLIPYRAHSAATLICLGGDKLVLGPMAELSPVDPSTSNEFNPVDPNDPQKQRRVAISVEDVISYFLLAKEKASIREEQMAEVYRQLTDKIHPLALGNVYRSHRMIRLLARKLLLLHMDESKQKHKMDEIIRKLTEDLCIHGYLISREEADKELGLNIEFPDPETEGLMWELFKAYETDMGLSRPFDAPAELGTEQSRPFVYEAAYIESSSMADAFVFKGMLRKTAPPAGGSAAALDLPSPPQWKEVSGTTED